MTEPTRAGVRVLLIAFALLGLVAGHVLPHVGGHEASAHDVATSDAAVAETMDRKQHDPVTDDGGPRGSIVDGPAASTQHGAPTAADIGAVFAASCGFALAIGMATVRRRDRRGAVLWARSSWIAQMSIAPEPPIPKAPPYCLI